MKRDSNSLNKGKIIPFPGLKERYFEKGLEALDQHDFQTATEYLSQAYELDPENQQFAFALLTAYYENGNYQKAKEIGKQLLHKGAENFFDILNVYILNLIQLHEFDQIIAMVEPLLEENEIPHNHVEHFRKLLSFSKKAVSNMQMNRQEEKQGILEWKELSLEEQLFHIGLLKDRNVRPLLNTLMELLSDHEIHPIIKTVICNILREQEIEQAIFIRKFSFEGEFIPKELPHFQEILVFQQIIHHVEMYLEHENPVLLQQIIDMIHRHAFILYPFELSKGVHKWAAGYIAMGYQLYGEDWKKHQLMEDFQVTLEEMAQTLEFINYLEKHSFSMMNFNS